MKQYVNVGIIGDFNPNNNTHLATNEAIEHAANSLDLLVKLAWLPTPSLENQPALILNQFDALWCSPGSPYQSMIGALLAIQFAREQDIPFIGTWGGFQHTLVEYARNVIGLKDAEHEESSPDTSRLLISQLSCSLVGASEKITIVSDSFVHQIYGCDVTEEKYRCNYSLNPAYQSQISQGNLKVVGVGEADAVRIIELAGYRYFVATLFMPQMNSTEQKPHPLIVSYLEKARGYSKVRQTSQAAKAL